MANLVTNKMNAPQQAIAKKHDADAEDYPSSGVVQSEGCGDQDRTHPAEKHDSTKALVQVGLSPVNQAQ